MSTYGRAKSSGPMPPNTGLGGGYSGRSILGPSYDSDDSYPADELATDAERLAAVEAYEERKLADAG